jgi:hypothetical protein
MLTLCRMIKRQWRISTNEDNTATPVGHLLSRHADSGVVGSDPGEADVD